MISALIPVSFFEDPVFTISSLSRVSRKVNKTIYEGNYSSGGVPTGLIDHVQKGYYDSNPNAPNFLMRFEGNFSSDPNGIETFVDITELSAQGISVDTFDPLPRDESVIDYLFFDVSDSTTGHTVTGMPGWFRIDTIDNHDIKYGV